MRSNRLLLGAIGAVSLLAAAPVMAQDPDQPTQPPPPDGRYDPQGRYYQQGRYQPGYYQQPSVRRRARRFSREHFLLGAEAVALVFLDETGDRPFMDHGGGGRFFLGGRLSDRFELHLAWQPTWHGSDATDFRRPFQNGVALSTFSLDFKIYPAIGRVQPYFIVGPSAYMLHDWELRVFSGGAGWHIGGGLDIFLAESLSLGMRVEYRGVGLVDYDDRGEDVYLSMLGFGLNLTGRF